MTRQSVKEKSDIIRTRTCMRERKLEKRVYGEYTLTWTVYIRNHLIRVIYSRISRFAHRNSISRQFNLPALFHSDHQNFDSHWKRGWWWVRYRHPLIIHRNRTRIFLNSFTLECKKPCRRILWTCAPLVYHISDSSAIEIINSGRVPTPYSITHVKIDLPIVLFQNSFLN